MLHSSSHFSALSHNDPKVLINDPFDMTLRSLRQNQCLICSLVLHDLNHHSSNQAFQIDESSLEFA